MPLRLPTFLCYFVTTVRSPAELFLSTSEVIRYGLFFLLLLLVVALFVRSERRHLFRLILTYGFSVVLRIASVIFVANDLPTLARTVIFLSLLFQGIAFLNLAAIIFFSGLLRLVRVETPRILRDVALAVSYVALLLFLFSVHKVDVGGIIATSAVVTAIIGFSLQDVLGNLMGGIALQLDRSIAPGDWIRLGELNGIVREISWRQTSIETRNGDMFVVPNSILMKNQVMIQGRRWDGTIKERRWVNFSVDYRFSPTLVLETMREALRREPIENVAVDPSADVLLLEFRESAALYAVRYWLTDLSIDEAADSAIRVRVFYALTRARIPLSIPSSTLFLRRERDDRTELLRDEEAQRRHKAVVNIPLFKSLTPEELQHVAESLIYTPFVPGEAIVVQGHPVHHLYILARGEVDIRVSIEGSHASTVARLEAPDIFGEMGMLTGDTRRATVVALTETECWRLDKEQFEEILHRRPQMANEISQMLAQREVELAAVREGLSEEAKLSRLASEHRSLLARIEKFFGL